MILITGHRGFIGTKLSKLIGRGIYGIDLQDGFNLLSCALPHHSDVEVIYHLAAQTSVESSWRDPVHDMDNIRITARLVKAFPDAKIVYANSAAAIDPKSPYGFSKWASAEYLKKFHKNYVICTLPNIYGGDKSVVDLFKGKEKVIIYGDGEQIRDYVHVDDIVSGLFKAKDWPVGEYQLGSGHGTTVLELAEGKTVEFKSARKEERESVLKNTTPNWNPIRNVIEYINE